MIYRALIKTHHMTSRKKIQRLCKATKAQQCSVVIKTGRPPGVMIAEGEEQRNVQEWIEVVKARHTYFAAAAMTTSPALIEDMANACGIGG